jgi:hypothetical protein
MDESIRTLKQATQEAKVEDKEKMRSLQRLRQFVPDNIAHKSNSAEESLITLQQLWLALDMMLHTPCTLYNRFLAQEQISESLDIQASF